MNITNEQLKELENYLMDLPTKYGLPLLQFFDKIKNEKPKEDEITE